MRSFVADRRPWTWLQFGRAKESFLRRFLKLERGIPSHDTFSRVFRLLDPEPFRACFITFMARFAEAVQGVIAIDGCPQGMRSI